MRIARIAIAEKGEVVGVGLEAVGFAEHLVQGSELAVWDLDRLAAVFADEVFVVVIHGEAPCSRYAVSVVDVVNKSDTAQVL